MAPKQPDPGSFELVVALQRASRRATLVSVVLALTTLTLTLGLFLQAARPIPVVFRPDTATEAASVIYAGGEQIPVREIDAKRFLVHSGELLHGWSSATVVKDLTDASMVMTARWRKLFQAEVNRVVDVPRELVPEGKETQLGYYAALKVRNTLDWKWDSIKCERNDSTRMWGCYARVTVETQPLVGDPLPAPPRKNLIVRTSFSEVPVTKNTIDGLLIDFWDQRDADEPVAPTAAPANPSPKNP
jgi:hypothetical protein